MEQNPPANCSNMGKDIDASWFWGKDTQTAAHRASYIHNLLTCYAKAKGLTSISTFYDIAAFYENVSHEQLRVAASHYSYNLGLLRALCVMYRSPRHARWGASVSGPTEANGTIVAGCSCATGTAKLMMLSVLRDIAISIPTWLMTSRPT